MARRRADRKEESLGEVRAAVEEYLRKWAGIYKPEQLGLAPSCFLLDMMLSCIFEVYDGVHAPRLEISRASSRGQHETLS